MVGVIYKITNNLNGKVYIGQTVQPLRDRWYRHCGNYGSTNENNMAIKRAIKKYGKKNFTIEEIESCDYNDLDEKERFWINYYNSYNEGYNSTLGGQGGAKLQKLLPVKDKVIEQYNKGLSLREVGKHFNVDHATVRLLLQREGIALRKVRTYKFTQSERERIVKMVNNGVSRKEIVNEFQISKAYLSQLMSGKRRI